MLKWYLNNRQLCISIVIRMKILDRLKFIHIYLHHNFNGYFMFVISIFKLTYFDKKYLHSALLYYRLWHFAGQTNSTAKDCGRGWCWLWIVPLASIHPNWIIKVCSFEQDPDKNTKKIITFSIFLQYFKNCFLTKKNRCKFMYKLIWHVIWMFEFL